MVAKKPKVGDSARVIGFQVLAQDVPIREIIRIAGSNYARLSRDDEPLGLICVKDMKYEERSGKWAIRQEDLIVPKGFF
jgi:hypothetical protein